MNLFQEKNSLPPYEYFRYTITEVQSKDANDNVHSGAKLHNYGDIVLVPGVIEVFGEYANLKNEDNTAGALYICEVNEAIVPITPTQADPTRLEERRQFSPSYPSTFTHESATSFINEGVVANAKVELVGNGLYGKLTVIE